MGKIYAEVFGPLGIRKGPKMRFSGFIKNQRMEVFQFFA